MEENGRFEAAYRSPVTEANPPPETVAATPVTFGAAAPAEGLALEGCVLTPGRSIDPGYVVIQGSEIQAVTETRPQAVTVHPTGGVITPGLIDLHGHPEFNVFAAWEPPVRFLNRYAWRGSELYHRLVRDPQNHLLDVLPDWTQRRYAEIRALVGGVTAIQGTGGLASTYEAEALVRNVDKWIFGAQIGRSMIDLPSGSFGMEGLTSVLAGIERGDVKAFYVHLAEGMRDNERSQAEFGKLVDLNALTAVTVLIHGTALTVDQFGDVADAGAKLVWSPQSNLRLYGETTLAGAALQRGVTVGLGADWLPSGSTSLLAEVKVARRCLALEGPSLRRQEARRHADPGRRQDRRPRRQTRHVGGGSPGRPGCLRAPPRGSVENVVEAEPGWVDLVMINGDLTYGREDLITDLTDSVEEASVEPVRAWGKRMLLDTSYMVNPDGEHIPTLEELRTELIKAYPQVGPIFA